jgi:hypothetical protein
MFELTDLPLPRYKSTKTVEALRIETIEVLPHHGRSPYMRFSAYSEATGGATITPTDKRYPPFHVGLDYLLKHEPQPGGYWVRYKDGYLSYCPGPQFEDGNERIEAK